jgi:hypothetical protein
MIEDADDLIADSMMTKFATNEDAYFQWLVSQVQIEQNGNRPRTYHELMEQLHNREFVWIVPNDDNRVADGFDLRLEFLRGGQYRFPFGVSTLEVIVALSRRLEFNAEGPSREWAWQLIKNLRLHKMADPLSFYKRKKIDEILDNLIWRTYQRNGLGGFFPLKDTDDDQTKIEIWYQMSAYIIDLRGL